jgi:hypothetical protein
MQESLGVLEEAVLSLLLHIASVCNPQIFSLVLSLGSSVLTQVVKLFSGELHRAFIAGRRVHFNHSLSISNFARLKGELMAFLLREGVSWTGIEL